LSGEAVQRICPGEYCLGGKYTTLVREHLPCLTDLTWMPQYIDLFVIDVLMTTDAEAADGG